MASLIHKLLLLAGLSCPAFLCSAQQDTSIDVQTTYFHRQHAFFSSDLVGQPLLPIQDYSLVEGGYRGSGGEYRPAQQAQRQRDLFFNADGVRRLRKILVSGSFTYSHLLQDSVGYTLRNDASDPAPYYFYAARPGNWQVEQYALRGRGTYSFLRDKAGAGFGVDYTSSDGWRSNDPRSEYFTYHMLVDALLFYRPLPGHLIGLSAGIVRNSNSLTWEYRNDNNSTVPDSKVYLQDGYGYVESLTGLTGGYVSGSGKGYTLQAIYGGHFPFGSLTLKGSYINTRSVYYRNPVGQGEKRVDYGRFNEDQYAAGLYWQYTAGANRFSLDLTYLDQLGKDFNNTLGGNNYVYSLSQVDIHPLLTHFRNGRPLYEIGVAAGLSDRFQADGIAGQRTEYQVVHAGLSAAWYFRFGTEGRCLRTAIEAGWQTPLFAESSTPPQLYNFTTGVVFRDYYYYDAASYRGCMQLLYTFPVRTTMTFIKLKGNYQLADIGQGQTSLIPLSYPGKEHWSWQISIGLTL